MWEFSDHSVNIGTEDAPKFTYGGDFDEELHDGNFCVDGLIGPDRIPHSGILEYKQVIKPFDIVSFDKDSGKITVKNLRYFASLEDANLLWGIYRNGVELYGGEIKDLDIPPQKTKEYDLPLGDTNELTGEIYLNISVVQNTDRPWAEKGYEIGHSQFLIASRPMKTVAKTNARVRLEENEKEYVEEFSC